MKKILLCTILALSIQAYGQINYIDVNPMAGYHFGGRAYFYEGDIKVDNSAIYGITLSLPIGWGTTGEFSYSRADSKMKFYPKRPDYDPDDAGVASNYFLLGAMKELGEGPLKAFGGLTLGLTWFDVKRESVSDPVRFTFSLVGGAKYMISDRVSIKVQGRLLMPISFNYGGMYCGIGGGGSSCGVSTGGSVFVQGDISGGLIFRIGATE